MSCVNYFHLMVEPTFNEYVKDQGSIRKACLAAIVINQFFDHYAVEYQITVKSIREKYSDLNQCIALIHDMADATKHSQLKNKNRTITSFEQVQATPGLFNAPFGFGSFSEAVEVFIAIDDAELCVLPIIQSGLDICKRLITELGGVV